jgi:hypothetical protein
VLAMSFSTASFCASRLTFMESAFSWYDLRRVSASLASSSV